MRSLVILLFTVGALGAVELPPVAEAGKGAYVMGELIYPLEGKPTPQCHASTIAEAKDGLVAAWFGGTREKHPDVGIWLSRRNSDGWSRPVEVANGVQSKDKRHPCWNPVLFQPREGPLLLFYKVGPTPRSWWGMLMKSEDGGKTWSNPTKLGEHEELVHLAGPVKNKPLQLADGAILCGSSTEHKGWRVHFEVTRDLGKTWEVIGPIHDGKTFSAIQPGILNHGEGKLQILCRSKQHVVTQSWSEDHGKTWSAMSKTTLPNPSAGTDVLTLKDGRHLIVYNHTKRGRGILNVALSKDGTDWRPVVTLEKSSGEFSYPAVIQTKDGAVHITYTYQRRSVKHVVLDPSKL